MIQSIFVVKATLKDDGTQNYLVFQTVNIYIVYEKERSINISSCSTLENSLFGAVKLTKHVDVDLYKYSGYGIGFDRKGS